MKVKLCILLFFFSFFASGQNSNEKILLASKGNFHKYYVQIDESNGYVMSVLNMQDKVGQNYCTVDTLNKSEDNNEFIFIGRNFKIQLINNEINIIVPKEFKRNNSIKLDTVSDISSAYLDINNGIWWNVFYKMCSEINKSFPLQHSCSQNGFHYWETFTNKNEYSQDFQDFAKNKVKFIKDSLTTLNTTLVKLTNELLFEIDTIKYNNLKNRLIKLPMENKSNSWYFGTVINALCNSRPEYFFKLVEDMPDKKDILFVIANTDKNIRNNLKKAKTNSPVKKEFIKYRRRQIAFEVQSITIGLVGTIGFYGGIIYLILK